MIHIAPDGLYKVLQQDVDWAVGNNYQVFFEGVKKDPPKKASTSNESKIKKFFLFLLDLYPVFAAALGISLQQKKIVYPKDAVNADITFAELARELDKNGFRCNFLLWFFSIVPKKKLKKAVGDAFAKHGDLNATMDSLQKRLFSKFVAWFLLRKAFPIILGYRNEVAVAKVRAHSNGCNVFIHYGERHINGLVRLLKKDGWAVKETSHIDLAEFC
jgi:hypothetical protein